MGQNVAEVMCRVDDLAEIARNTRLVRLRPETGKPFSFRAGQYAKVGFEGVEPRYFSMASCPEDAAFEFHIRGNGTDPVGDFVLHELQRGTRAGVSGPFGEAWLREDHRGPILAVAGGSGLAPIKSIVETALRRGMTQDIYLYAGARDEADVYLEEHFIELVRQYPRLHYISVLSNPGSAVKAGRRLGLVSDAVAQDFRSLGEFKAHVAGPLPMVISTIAVLRALDMRDANIHADAFEAAELAVKKESR